MWRELTGGPLPEDERTPVIAAIFSDPEEIQAAENLRGDHAQTFVNLADEVLAYASIQTPTQADPTGRRWMPWRHCSGGSVCVV